MKKITQVFIIAGIMAFFGSCKDKEPEPDPEVNQPQTEITIEPFYGSLALTSDQVVFTTVEGYAVKLREMKIILTDIHNGSHVLSAAAMYDSGNGNSLLKVNGTSANFGSLDFNIGVEQSLNHSDPAAFPNDHALNIVHASDMHWSWNPGYIFFKVEMIADTLDDGIENFNHVISFHVGQDTTFRQKQLTNLTWNKVSENLEQLRLKVDIEKLLQNGSSTIDIRTESTTHSSPAQMPLSIKLADNFKAALNPF